VTKQIQPVFNTYVLSAMLFKNKSLQVSSQNTTAFYAVLQVNLPPVHIYEIVNNFLYFFWWQTFELQFKTHPKSQSKSVIKNGH